MLFIPFPAAELNGAVTVPPAVLAADKHACHSCAAGDLELGFSAGYVRLDENREHHEEIEHDDHASHDSRPLEDCAPHRRV